MRKMIIYFTTVVISLVACKKEPNNNYEKPSIWEQKTTLPSGYLSAAVSFVINDKLYIGLGIHDNTIDNFYEYEYSSDQWKTIKSFPSKRTNAIGFSIGNFGYVGLGKNYVSNGSGGLTVVYYNDLWKYNPTDDSWTKMSDFPGTPRAFSTSFVIEGNAYITGGSSVNDNDLWEYNANLNSWTKKADFPGGCSSRGISFVIANKGYVGFGWSGFSVSSCNDLWEYEPINNTWTQKADFPGKARRDSKGIAISDHALIFCGVSQDFNGSEYLNDIWIYDQVSNLWSQADTCYIGKGRSEMILNIVENHILVGLGIDAFEKRYDEIWQYNLILK